MRFSLPGFALKRPVTIVMISLSMLTVGGIAWFKMPLTFLPRVDRPVIGCHIPYPGGSPEQVEQQITIPVEGEFRTVPGLRRIRTTSDTDGCSVFMHFDLDVDMTLATAEVRDRMERLKLVLPDEVDRMLLQRFSSSSIPIMAFGLFRSGDMEEFAHLARTVIEPRISRVDGVANVDILSPVPQKEVLIEFDQDTLRSLSLGLPQVIATLQESSLNLSVGELTDGDRKFYVRAVGEYRRLEDVAGIVVAPTGLRLREVATVRYSSRDEAAHVSLDGKGGVILLVIKESEANTVATCEAVHAELERVLSEPIFDGVVPKLFFDQSALINRALRNLLMEGLYGGAMALAVLFFFLHRIRPTVIVALAIPTSLVVAFVFMFFLGMNLNLVTMVSMIIAVGMLVDNAIVVVENIIRRRQLGDGPEESAKRGATEVGLAIFAATATTWVVFVPMYYLETGRMSVFMKQLGLPLMVSLGGSLVIALTVIPLAMSRMTERQHANVFQDMENWVTGAKSRLGGAIGRVFALLARLDFVQRTINAYSWGLGWTLRWRLAALGLLGCMIWLTLAVPVKRVGMRDLPKLDTREVTVDVDLEQNFDIAMARDLFALLEAKIEERRDELGIKNVLTVHGTGGGMIEVYLYTEDDGPRGENPPFDTEEVLGKLTDDLPARLPGAEIALSIADAGHSGTGRGVSVQMRGDDTQMLAEYAERFTGVMKQIGSLRDVATDLERTKQEMQLKIDEPLAEKAGISPMIIAQTVDAALRGARLPYMKQAGREISVWGQFREEDRKSKANLDNVAVPNIQGTLTPLSQLVEFTRDYTPSSILRIDGKNVVNISAKTNTDDLSAVQKELRAAAGMFYLPLGYNIQFGEELEELSENMFQFSTTLFMAVILIYLVMSALFESFLLPLSILTSVPMALGGSMWMLFFCGTQLDTVTLIGNILMVGIIVNNGIVIIDHINNLRSGFDNRIEAIVQAGRDRFRPVMMTAITTILGLVPLALARTGGAATFAGLGRALIGGLTVGTILTLFVVPLFYSLLDDFRRWCVNYFGGIAAMGTNSPTAS